MCCWGRVSKDPVPQGPAKRSGVLGKGLKSVPVGERPIKKFKERV